MRIGELAQRTRATAKPIRYDESLATLDHTDCTDPHRCHVISAGVHHPS